LKQINLTRSQLALVRRPAETKIFLEGPAGSGKTTASVARLSNLLSSGLSGDAVLVLTPQRTLADPYNTALRESDIPAGGMPSVVTVGGLARRMVELFWPILADKAGFFHPDEQPIFLTLETTQYYLAHVVRPLVDEGLFAPVTIDRNRLYNQIIDNLNKSAVVGFPPSQISERLKSAWMGEPSQLRIYDDVQTCADRFRQFCMENNLLDFSLQIEVFCRFLWSSPEVHDYLFRTYRHLIYDNLEEDYPVAHDLVHEWLPSFESALLIYDSDAGYRRFLGADSQSAYDFRSLCDQPVVFDESLVTPKAMTSLGEHLYIALRGHGAALSGSRGSLNDQPSNWTRDQISTFLDQNLLQYEYHRYYPEMLDWVVNRVKELVTVDGIPPGEIAILSPYLSGALRFLLVERLESCKIASRSHRPSRSLREEPATQCLLTLSALAYPEWEIYPTKFDVAYALVQAIQGMDLVRAQLLAEIVYRAHGTSPSLSSFDLIRPEMQERITYRLGENYEKLRLWLNSSRNVLDEFDYFLSRLFGELLSQPGFGFHDNYDAGQISANLIESVYKFRLSMGNHRNSGADSIELGALTGKQYLLTVQEGLIAAQYVENWRAQEEDAVLLAPAYTFLMQNRPVEVQFWLDIGSRGWFERIYQPLTQPYVLSRSWQAGRIWSDADEMEARRDALSRLILGLVRRCKSRIFLGLSELGEQGYEQRGPLLFAFQHLLREIHESGG
jgi:hypothetical protein